jgi:hypothetical protein
MRYRMLAATLLAGALVAGCTEDQSQTPVAPDLRFVKNTGAACNSTLSRTIKAEQMNLFDGATLKSVQDSWALVEGACNPDNADAANSTLLAYVNSLVNLYKGGSVLQPPKGADKETYFLTHVSHGFEYVGYGAVSLPSTDGPLDRVGAIRVIGVLAVGDTAELHTGDNQAALRLSGQNSTGDTRAHLFAIYPDADACTTDNLAFLGACYHFAAFPTVNPVFDPEIRVGVCSDNDDSGMVPGLIHVVGTSDTEVAGTAHGFPDCVEPTASTGSWKTVGGALTRLAWLATKAIAPNVAYATHGGLTGTGGKLSPWGGAELLTFNDQVNDNAGAFDLTANVGTWDSTVTSPGSIRVGLLGNYSENMIIMTQAGGACSKKNQCGGLILRGNLESASGNQATEGKYEITFVALQDAPGVKEAPFTLRDASGVQLARLSFVTISSQNRLYYNYNGKNSTGIDVGSWTRDEPLSFKFVVDLDANTVDLYVGTSTIAAASSSIGATAGLATISFEAVGIDSGIMGWDDIHVQRLSDK